MKKKYIDIRNDDDYEKFLRKIKYYKFFFNTEFDITREYKDLKDICFALNIKNRKDRITFIYDNACDKIDRENPCNACGFKEGKCDAHRDKKYINGCCRMCRYQSDKGCTSKNLACKLFNCSTVKKRYEVLEYGDIHILKALSLKNRTIVKSDYFSKRDDVLKDLYTFTLTYATIRIVYRIIRNTIWIIRNVQF